MALLPAAEQLLQRLIFPAFLEQPAELEEGLAALPCPLPPATAAAVRLHCVDGVSTQVGHGGFSAWWLPAAYALGVFALPAALLQRCSRRLRGFGRRGTPTPALFPDSD